MAHPYAGQAKSSQKARLKRLGASAGKPHGSSSMYKASSLPSKNAGSSTPMTISGGSSKKRPDRMAAGGSVGGSGGGKKRRPHATTNIIISHAGGRGGSGGGGGAGPNPPQPVPVPRPVPVPVNRPVPVPVGGGARPMAGPVPGGPPPGVGPGMAAAGPPRPPIAPPAGPPPGAGLPMRPPGMAAGGAVKKAAKGGFLKEANSPKAGDAYPGFPHSPTTKAKSTVSAKASGGTVGGAVKKAGGGGITLTKKLEFGGGTGLGMGVGAGPGMGGGGPGQAGPAGAANAALGAGPGRVPLPPQQGAPNVSGRQAIPFAQPNVVPLSGFGARNFSTRPAPGTTTSYAKKGGFIKGAKHDDEEQDKKLIKKMIGKKASGGGVGPGLVGYKYRTNSPTGGKGKGLSPYSDAKIYRNQGKGFADGGNVHGAGSAAGRMARNAKIPAKTEL